MLSHRNPQATGLYLAFTLLDSAGGQRRLTISRSHYMAVSRVPSPTCRVLSAAAGNGTAGAGSSSAWAATAAQASWMMNAQVSSRCPCLASARPWPHNSVAAASALARAQRQHWVRDHSMALPLRLTPGDMAWAVVNDTVTPACILSVEEGLQEGAFSFVVRVRELPAGAVKAEAERAGGLPTRLLGSQPAALLLPGPHPLRPVAWS